MNYQPPICDAPIEKALEDIASLAAHICQTPIAAVWLCNGTNQWFKSSSSKDIPELAEWAADFCQQTLEQSDLFIVQNPHQNRHFANNPLVISPPYIRFYAGVSIIPPSTAANDLAGLDNAVNHKYQSSPSPTVCLPSPHQPYVVLGVMDFLPRQLTSEQVEALQALTRQAIVQLELSQTLTQIARLLTESQLAERQRERFFTLSLDMLCVAAFDGYFKRLNPNIWEKTLGYTNEELLDRPFIEFVHPEDRESTVAEMQKLRAGLEVVGLENRYCCKDGGYKWLLWNATPVTEQNLIYAAARDITDRKQAEAALHKAAVENLHLVRAMDSASEGIVITDPGQADNPIIYANSAFSKISGYEPDKVIGHNCRFLQGLGTDPLAVAEIRTAIAEQREAKVTLLNYRQDGQPFWNELKISPAFDDAGNLLYFIGIQTDITERMQSEEALRQSERRFRFLAELIPQQVWTALPNGQVDYLNQRILDYFSKTSGQILSKGWQAVLHPEDVGRWTQDWQRSLQTGEPYEVELRLQRATDSGYHWHIVRALPLRDGDGEIVGWFGTNTDINDRKRAEQAVSTHAQQQAAVAELGQLALAGIELIALMNQAVKLIAKTLAVEYCQVLELELGGNAFLLKAAVGFPKGLVGNRITGSHNRSQAGYTLIAKQPIVVEDLRVETRFSGEPLLHNHRVVSSVTVLIQGQVRPFGVLGVHSTQHRKFTKDDIHFLQATANVLATAMERQRTEESLRESQERYALAVRGSNEGLWDWNLRSNEVFFSPRWKAILGWEEDEVGDGAEEWFNRVHPEDLDQVEAEVAEHLEGLTPHMTSEHRMRHRDGTYRWVLSRGLAVRDANGKAYRFAGSQTDITNWKRAEERLTYDAFHDALTRLPNRSLFMDRLGVALARQERRANYQLAVLFLDLDRFKVVNDSLGHVVGDQLLVAIARRLENCLRTGDTVARLGGDEFVMLMEDIHALSDATNVANRIQKALKLPFDLNGQEVFITASIGITLAAGDSVRGNWGGESHLQSSQFKVCNVKSEDLLRDADIALYRAKALGKARYEVFDGAMHERAVRRMQLENDLRRAIETSLAMGNENGENRETGSIGGCDSPRLLVHYQPIVLLSTGRITGFEALVRLLHPERGLVSPADFIPVAEETGLIVPLGAWVLREACRQTRAWQQILPQLTISVNLSTRQFSQPDLTQQIEQTLLETRLEAQYLKLEITESAIMENAGAAKVMLQQLRALGIQLSIDDFGTGYSSLSYLHRFPINTLKIDRSFVSQMSPESENSEIVRAIVTLAHHLGMDVIAEGVETAYHLAQLQSLQCEQGQGYFFSRPLDGVAAIQLLLAEAKIGD